MLISIDAEEVFDKIRHPFIIKTMNKLGIEGNFLNLVNIKKTLQLRSYLVVKNLTLFL